MKKTKLFVEPEFEFELLGFVAPLKDYKMAWVINDSLGINLVKAKDFQLEFINQPQLKISQFILEKEYGYIQLLKNKAYTDGGNALYLIPELKIMDYFLLLQDLTLQLNINAYIERLSTNLFIQNVVKLDVSKIKSKENFLTY